MTASNLPDFAAFFDLDPAIPSGLRWSRSLANKFNANAGCAAGWKDNQGYFKVQVLGKTYPCHRIVLLLNGVEAPDGFSEVDHIDRNRANNSLANLRWTNRSGNIRNRRYKNETGRRYVAKAFGRFRAQYSHPTTKAKVHVGTYDDPDTAHYKALAHRLENHWI